MKPSNKSHRTLCHALACSPSASQSQIQDSDEVCVSAYAPISQSACSTASNHPPLATKRTQRKDARGRQFGSSGSDWRVTGSMRWWVRQVGRCYFTLFATAPEHPPGSPPEVLRGKA